MVEMISTLIQGSGPWATILGPIFYLFVVGPVLGIIVFVLTRKRKRDK